MKPILLLLLLVSLGAAPVMAQEKGYKVVRPDGSVEFTDQPEAGAQEFNLPKAQTYEAPQLPAIDSGSTAKPEKAADYQLVITSPSPDQTYQAGEESIQVRVTLRSALQTGHKLVILLDGVVVAEGKTSIVLREVERGSHSISAEVRDGAGKTIASATPVTFHRFQPSLLFPGRVPTEPPKPPVPPPPAPTPTPPAVPPTF